eukprot:TRINITY_DN28194_c0_g1_i1.p1 TRINITY_DN28194_c0_g1~~TRINITY_DN28194_c0_g1_i1.p1  ORF type:complete len:195 (-),score=37.44 TRINITY_DN28194_c0_g1_i1:122-646(-)
MCIRDRKDDIKEYLHKVERLSQENGQTFLQIFDVEIVLHPKLSAIFVFVEMEDVFSSISKVKIDIRGMECEKERAVRCLLKKATTAIQLLDENELLHTFFSQEAFDYEGTKTQSQSPQPLPSLEILTSGIEEKESTVYSSEHQATPEECRELHKCQQGKQHLYYRDFDFKVHWI